MAMLHNWCHHSSECVQEPADADPKGNNNAGNEDSAVTLPHILLVCHQMGSPAQRQRTNPRSRLPRLSEA